MADQKETKQALINIEYKGVIKPLVDASAAGLSCGGFTWLANGPFWGGFVFGASSSFLFHWGSHNLSLPKALQRKPHNAGRQIKVQGEKWTFDQVAPGVLVRESYGGALLRLLGIGQRKPVQRNADQTPVPKPQWMTELVFHSHYNGYPLQILVQDAFRFLRLAQKLQREKGRGAGLSERTWGRKANERPLWYQELPCPAWYHAMMFLIYAAERYGEKQLIVEVGPRQIALAREATQVLDALRWLEDQRGNYGIAATR